MASSHPEGRRKGRIEQRGKGLRIVVDAGTDPVTGRRVYERELVNGTDDAAWRKAQDKLVELRAKVLKQQNASSAVKLTYTIDEVAEAPPPSASTPPGLPPPTAKPPKYSAPRLPKRMKK